MAKNRPAGGIGSRQVTSSKSGRKVEPKGSGINPGYAGQIGIALGNKAMDGGGKKLTKAGEPMKTPGYASPQGVNVNAKPNVMARGTQSCHGPVAGSAPTRGVDILNQFEPDSASVAPRK
jgi:hypothetical protein